MGFVCRGEEPSIVRDDLYTRGDSGMLGAVIADKRPNKDEGKGKSKGKSKRKGKGKGKGEGKDDDEKGRLGHTPVLFPVCTYQLKQTSLYTTLPRTHSNKVIYASIPTTHPLCNHSLPILLSSNHHTKPTRQPTCSPSNPPYNASIHAIDRRGGIITKEDSCVYMRTQSNVKRGNVLAFSWGVLPIEALVILVQGGIIEAR